MKFHLDRDHGMVGGWYAVHNTTGKESATYPLKWMAWLAGLKL